MLLNILFLFIIIATLTIIYEGNTFAVACYAIFRGVAKGKFSATEVQGVATNISHPRYEPLYYTL